MVDNKMLNRVKGLFAKADSVEGTPEADTLREKAFELLAKYGIDEAMARGSAGSGNVDGDTMKAVTFTYTGDRFGYEKMYLVNRVSKSLHCDAVQLHGEHVLQIFGLSRHLERVKFLIQLLMPQLLSSATQAIPANPFAGRDPKDSARLTAEHRAEFMIGFADRIGSRIQESEDNAASTYDRENGGTGASLMLKSDFDRAQAAMYKKYAGMIGQGRGRSVGRGEGYRAGHAAGDRADVGNTRVGAGRQAIG